MAPIAENEAAVSDSSAEISAAGGSESDSNVTSPSGLSTPGLRATGHEEALDEISKDTGENKEY